MRRFGAAITLGLLALIITIMPASAGVGWCRSDPLISLDGQLADIFVNSALDAPLKVTGATKIVITVPAGVQPELILSGPGFGKGEEVTFAYSNRLRKTKSGIEVQVAVYVPATNSRMPVQVEFAGHVVGILDPATVEGTANTWVVLKTML